MNRENIGRHQNVEEKVVSELESIVGCIRDPNRNCVDDNSRLIEDLVMCECDIEVFIGNLAEVLNIKIPYTEDEALSLERNGATIGDVYKLLEKHGIVR